MIAADFLRLRAAIDDALAAIAAQTHTLGFAADPTLELLRATLAERFTITVLGPQGSGKTTLLEALCGVPLRVEDAAPVAVFVHQEQVGNVFCGEGISMHPLAHPHLREFQLVDTVGCERLSPWIATLHDCILRNSDAVLFVAPADHPFDDAAWRFLESIYQQPRLRNLAFILQKCDSLASPDAASLCRRIARKAEQTLGAAFHVFAVSAQKALAAVGNADAGQESGLPALEHFLATHCIGSESRRAGLRTICAAGSRMASELATAAREMAADYAAKSALLATLETRMHESRLRTLRQADAVVWQVANIFDARLRRADQWLGAQLTLLGMWRLALDRSAIEPARLLDSDLRKTVLAQLETSLRDLHTGLEAVWHSLHARLAREFREAEGAEPGTVPQIEKQELLERVGNKLGDGSAFRKLADATSQTLARLRLRIRILLSLFAAGLLVAAMGAATGVHSLVPVGLGCALAAFLTGYSLAVCRGSRLSLALRSAIEAQREPLLRTIEEHLRLTVAGFYGRLAGSLHSLAGFQTVHTLLLAEPVAARLSEIEATLRQYAEKTYSLER